jgi:hypothetical protein
MYLTEKQIEARIKALKSTYAKAKRDINAKLRSATLTDFQKFRYNELAKQIDTTIRALNIEAKRTAEAIVPGSYKEGTDFCAEALANMDKKFPAVNMGNRINSGSIQVFVDQITTDLVNANTSLAMNAKRFLRQTQQTLISEANLNKLLAKGEIEGATRRETTKALSGELRQKLDDAIDGGKVAIKCKDGKTRLYEPDEYAEIVTRTQTIAARTEGIIRTGESAGLTLFRVSAHEGSCEKCQVFQGKVFSIVEGDDFPFLSAANRPPYHPRCRHFITPVDADVLRERGGYDNLMALSNDKKAVIHDGNDADRVAAGGEPHTKVVEVAA